MSRRRMLVVAGVVVCALVAAGALWWRAVDRREQHRAERRDRRVSGVLAAATRDLAVATGEAGSAEQLIATTAKARDTLSAFAASLRAEQDRVRADRDTAAIGALASGVRAGVVAQCLSGVQQAMNQLSVGDRGGLLSLQRVAGPCREAAA